MRRGPPGLREPRGLRARPASRARLDLLEGLPDPPVRKVLPDPLVRRVPPDLRERRGLRASPARPARTGLLDLRELLDPPRRGPEWPAE